MRGDRYAVTNLTLGLPGLFWLVQDDPEASIRLSDEVLERWPRESFQMQDYYHMLSVSNAMLYQGQSPYELIESKWKALTRAQFLRIQLVAVEALHLRARAALAEGLPRVATKHARRILKHNAPWSNLLARLVLAGVAAKEGRMEEAVETLRQVQGPLLERHMPQYAMAAKWHAGRLIGGDQGAALMREAEKWADEEAVRNWPALAHMLAPGFSHLPNP